MDKEDDSDKMAGCFLICLLFLSLIPLMFLNVWMIWCGYTWAVLPIFETLPALTYKQVFCLYLFRCVAVAHPLSTKRDDQPVLSFALSVWGQLIFFVVFDLTLLGVLWFIH